MLIVIFSWGDIMEVGNRVHDPCVKVSLELESLLQHHFHNRQHSKRVLKDHLREAELEITHLRLSVSAYAEQLKQERTRAEALQRDMENAQRCHAAELMNQDKRIRERLCDVDAQARLLVVKTEECERRLQSLQEKETELLNREANLRSHQASFEAGIIPAQRQAEAERARMHYAREKAEQFLEEARVSALATEERRHQLEKLYNIEMRCFGVEKEESIRRMHIMRQEMLGAVCLISSRQMHAGLAENKAAERIRILEQELASRKDVCEMREKELYSRHQRERQHLKDEKDRLMSMKEAMRQDYRIVLESIHLLGNECSTEPERLQVNALRDLEKLLFSMLDDQHLGLDKKL
ncbi:uncharacterized protein Tco025E_08089 [Trypanosoma conorhini]|uniref:Uncharacterized protein n=1 Tax=Trypanosoma conorhini TaxID=83891 RepID=A0A3R7MEP5_9TRYP|nr:uncharacterized protein Tco025E_08089 [Trypanosoma conorhini]RNF04435.1 hypothetical protein Tco025E_08089 [Trypanosoma conorhini]